MAKVPPNDKCSTGSIVCHAACQTLLFMPFICQKLAKSIALVLIKQYPYQPSVINCWLRLIVHSCVRKLSWPYTHCVRKLSWPYTHCVRKLSWPYTASIIICSRKAVTAAVEAAAAISAEPLKGSAAMCSRKHCVYGQESGWPYTLCKIKHPVTPLLKLN